MDLETVRKAIRVSNCDSGVDTYLTQLQWLANELAHSSSFTLRSLGKQIESGDFEDEKGDKQ